MVLPHYAEKEKNICGISGDNRVVPQMRQKNSVPYIKIVTLRLYKLYLLKIEQIKAK